MARKMKEDTSARYSADMVYAAAAFAFLKNGEEYQAHNVYNYNDAGESYVAQEANKLIIQKVLETPELLTQEHYALGREARQIINGLIFKKLAGANFNDLTERIIADSQKEEYRASQTFGLPAYAIKLAMEQKKRDAVDQVLAFANTQPIGKVGERLDTTGTVLRSIFSHQYNTFFITVHTDEGNIVWFSFKAWLDPETRIEIRGTVKRLCENGQTQLNRVKVEAKNLVVG